MSRLRYCSERSLAVFVVLAQLREIVWRTLSMFYRCVPERVHLVVCIDVDFCFNLSLDKYDYYGFVDCASNCVFAIDMTAVTNDPAQKHLC